MTRETLSRPALPEQEPLPHEYEILTHGNLIVNGEPEPAEALRTRYVELTRRLIFKICGSGYPEDRYDTVIFLDKSARPLSWMVKEFWDDFAFQEEHFFEEDSPENNPENLENLRKSYRPEIKFLNIDKGSWINVAKDIEYDKDLQRDRWNGEHSADNVALTGLRAVFSTSDKTEKRPGTIDAEEVLGSGTLLDGKRVLVVDEVESTGATRSLASMLMKSAIGESGQRSRLAENSGHEFEGAATIDTACWMSSGLVRGKGGMRNTESPIWYRDDTGAKSEGLGKGVGGRNVGKSLRSPSHRQRTGALWLSTKLDDYETSQALRDDIKALKKDYDAGIIDFPKDKFVQWYPPEDSEVLRKIIDDNKNR